MSDVQDFMGQLPAASSVCNLTAVRIDKNAATGGVWTEVLQEGNTKIEFKVASSSQNKAYGKAMAEYVDKLQGKKSGKFKASDIDQDAFNRKRAGWAAEYIVKGWRTFIPELDANGSVVMVDSGDPDVGMVPKGNYFPVISDGTEWLRFNSGAVENVLKANTELLSTVMNFADDNSNFYSVNVEESADKSSITA
jgi:hypothetical protein